MKERVALAIATGFGSGFLRPFPGTWGSLPPLLIAWVLLRHNQPYLIGATLFVSVLSIWSAAIAERKYGHDARQIVIDEWAGMLLTLIWLPPTVPAYLTAFIAFRFFDVVKLPPAAQAERLPGGWGITLDDIFAGVYAGLAVRGVLWLAQRMGWF